MAKYNGIELKSIKTFMNHEGIDIYNADIYIGKRKVGKWKQSYMSGPDIIDINPDYDYNKIVQRLLDLNKCNYDPISVNDDFNTLQSEYCFDIILEDLVRLNDWEKQYKGYMKTYGNITFCVASDNYHEYHQVFRKMDKERAIQEMKTKNFSFFKDLKPFFIAFNSLKDFEWFQEIELDDIYSERGLKKKSKQRYNETRGV